MWKRCACSATSSPVFTPQRHANVERKRPPFEPPEKSPTTTRVEAYLRCRGISQAVIDHCLQAGILYESLPYHNCVFVGRDADGIPQIRRPARHLHLR